MNIQNKFRAIWFYLVSNGIAKGNAVYNSNFCFYNEEDIELVTEKGSNVAGIEVNTAVFNCGLVEIEVQRDLSRLGQFLVCFSTLSQNQDDHDIKKYGLKALKDSMFIDGGQIFISDTTDSDRWAFTKKHAFKGPISVNQNSGNKIRMYIITHEIVIEMFTALYPDAAKKIFTKSIKK